MLYRDDRLRYPENGPEARRGEDSVLLNALCDTVAVSAAVMGRDGLGYVLDD